MYFWFVYCIFILYGWWIPNFLVFVIVGENGVRSEDLRIRGGWEAWQDQGLLACYQWKGQISFNFNLYLLYLFLIHLVSISIWFFPCCENRCVNEIISCCEFNKSRDNSNIFWIMRSVRIEGLVNFDDITAIKFIAT